MIGYIYQITPKKTEKTLKAIENKYKYIGSTINLAHRIRQHRHNCIKGKESHRLLYKTIRNNGTFENWKLEILEEVEVSHREELYYYENALIDCLKPNLNIRVV